MFAGRSGPWVFGTGALIAVGSVVTIGGRLFPSVGVIPWAVAAGMWALVALFFRDPERRVGPGIVAAADGVVRELSEEQGWLRVGVFMNVTDVHVNRFPVDGRVEQVEDSGSGFRFAFDPAATHNVQRCYRLSTAIGPVEVIQMTGWFARRLVSYVHEGHRGAKGERLGMIRFGSRVDVRLPSARTRARVHLGQRVRAGETEIAAEVP
ncbi:MAG TPA: phosphatidylserine decarboxylase [Thermoplasmata archaeon]|nr:phosphatidylserine decarboxylase [Thermoplasmata archaeon]